MARHVQPARKGTLISTIMGTIARHPRLSAAVAFQTGVLLGQVMNNRAATLDALKRSVGSAPAALASALPAFGLFDNTPTPRSAMRQSRRKPSRGKRRKA